MYLVEIHISALAYADNNIYFYYNTAVILVKCRKFQSFPKGFGIEKNLTAKIFTFVVL